MREKKSEQLLRLGISLRWEEGRRDEQGGDERRKGIFNEGETNGAGLSWFALITTAFIHLATDVDIAISIP